MLELLSDQISNTCVLAFDVGNKNAPHSFSTFIFCHLNSHPLSALNSHGESTT